MRILLLIFFLILPLSTLAQAEKVLVKAKVAEVFSSPDDSKPRVLALAQNVKVTVLKTSGQWAHIEVDGFQCWIKIADLDIEQPAPVPEKQVKVQQVPNLDVSKAMKLKKPKHKPDSEPMLNAIAKHNEKVAEKEEEQMSVRHYSYYQGWLIGPTVGVSYSTLSGDVGSYRNPSLGTDLGLTLLKLNRNALGWEVSARYHQSGGNSATTHTELLINNIELSCMVNYTSEIAPNMSIKPCIGPALSFALSTELINDNKATDAKDMRSTNFGFVIGCDFLADHTFGKLVMGMRYNAGITDIDNSTSSITTGSFTISIGMLF